MTNPRAQRIWLHLILGIGAAENSGPDEEKEWKARLVGDGSPGAVLDYWGREAEQDELYTLPAGLTLLACGGNMTQPLASSPPDSLALVLVDSS